MSPQYPALAVVLGGFPRVSGDEPAIKAALDAAGAFSPRERG